MKYFCFSLPRGHQIYRSCHQRPPSSKAFFFTRKSNNKIPLFFQSFSRSKKNENEETQTDMNWTLRWDLFGSSFSSPPASTPFAVNPLSALPTISPKTWRSDVARMLLYNIVISHSPSMFTHQETTRRDRLRWLRPSRRITFPAQQFDFSSSSNNNKKERNPQEILVVSFHSTLKTNPLAAGLYSNIVIIIYLRGPF